MKIQIVFNEKEMSGFQSMNKATLECIKNANVKMDKTIEEQLAIVDKAFAFKAEGNTREFHYELDSRCVEIFFEGATAVLHRVGVWAVQTWNLVKELGQIDQEYDKRMRAYLNSKKEAE